ncbi:hypothetical protein IFM89_026184 [Coptis chinensis]|uniref:F-box domain-containing protein n=1 Tax=Coptis chinensis TaxID=261450 RepID=A0A835H634_9MAGN|nr:hypothetical protein IFM89_026184 [Coptis chinensis]
MSMVLAVEEEKGRWKKYKSSNSIIHATINTLDDGCLMHIFSFLPPIPDRYNTALVCQRWCYLACHPRLWLRVERTIKNPREPGVFPDIETAISVARPGDTILIAAGGNYLVCNIQINKPLCLVLFRFLLTAIISKYCFCPLIADIFSCRSVGGELPDEAVLICSRGSDSALEFMSTCKVANLTVKAELGCCLLHRSGRLTIEGCILQCEENPLDYLSCPIVSTASSSCSISSPALKSHGDSVSVSRTRIEGGSKAVSTNGTLALQRVRVIYARTAIFFWFDVDRQ